MKKQTQTSSSSYLPAFIDTAPMAAAYERLCAMIPLILAHPRARGLLENAREIGRVVRAFTRAEFSNYQRGLKLDMLSHGPWRERVLKELGGEAKLAAWDAAQERYQLRKETPAPEVKAGTWRKTPERLAEEERLKAHARKCARATAHPRIFRDPYRVDFEGQFRLAPLLRLSTPRRDPATVPFVIEDYNYDGTPIAKMSGFDAPVTVWPIEFRAAEKIERGVLEGKASSPVIPLHKQASLLSSRTLCLQSKHQCEALQIRDLTPSAMLEVRSRLLRLKFKHRAGMTKNNTQSLKEHPD